MTKQKEENYVKISNYYNNSIIAPLLNIFSTTRTGYNSWFTSVSKTTENIRVEGFSTSIACSSIKTNRAKRPPQPLALISKIKYVTGEGWRGHISDVKQMLDWASPQLGDIIHK